MPALPGGNAELTAAPGEPTATPPDGTGTTTDTTGAAVASTAPAESAAVVVASIPIVTGVKGVQMWDDNGNLLMSYDSGVTLSATGRSPDGDWLIVESAAGPGWVQTSQVIAYGVQQLAASPLPASTALAPTRGIEGAAAAVGAPAVSALATMTGTLTGASEAGAPEASTALATATPEGPAAPEVSASVTAVTATVAISDARLNVRSGPGLDVSDHRQSITRRDLCRDGAQSHRRVAAGAARRGERQHRLGGCRLHEGQWRHRHAARAGGSTGDTRDQHDDQRAGGSIRRPNFYSDPGCDVSRRRAAGHDRLSAESRR